jgi:hypothetical protein
MTTLLAAIEDSIPLPANATEAMPELTDLEEVEMRGRTVKLIADIQGVPIEPSEDARAQATQLAHQMMAHPETKLNLAEYPNETMAYLAGMVGAYQADLVQEFADLKRYVVNKLIKETDHPDARIRVAALTKLGEIDGVDAFKKRTEITVKHQSMEEVEQELLETLQKLEKRTIDIQARTISNESNA